MFNCVRVDFEIVLFLDYLVVRISPTSSCIRIRRFQHSTNDVAVSVSVLKIFFF